LVETLRSTRMLATFAFAIPAVLLGVIDAGLLLGWHQISPGQTAWLRKDPAVYQAGWEFLRRAPWAFPPTWLPTLDFPFGISASYLDVIPLAAIPLKLISPLLAHHFQYLGLYVTVCLVLQTWFGLRLMSRFTSDRLVIFLGALFFLNSPILLSRLLGHFSLCSQWLLVASLYYYFKPVGTAGFGHRLRPFALLLALSAGTSPYLSAMVLGIALADVAQVAFVGRELSRSYQAVLTAIISAGVLILCLLASLAVFGFITLAPMPDVSGAGYGAYSMNLLAPINPSGSSIIFRSFPVLPLQGYEGYNYLGAGIIALGVLCIARKPALLLELWSARLRPLLVICILFFLAALSAQIAVGPTVVGTVPLPHFAFNLVAVFRSSGRFFWPVHQLLTLGALVGTALTFHRQWAARVILAVALCVQFLDLSPIREAVAHESSLLDHTPLRAETWKTLAEFNRHLIVLPARQCNSVRTPGGDAAWPWFAGLAARDGMTLNSVHAARFSAQSNAYNCAKLPLEISQGNLRRDTAYVLGDRLALLASGRNRTHFCRRVDGFNLCTYDPGRADESTRLANIIWPPYVFGSEFQSRNPTPNWLRIQNFENEPGWGRWTLAKTAVIEFRVINPPPRDLRLDLEFTNANLSRIHQRQRAVLSLNGHEVGMLLFQFPANSGRRTVTIPTEYIRRGLNVLRFNLPDAIPPHEIGVNTDPRPLSLYLHALKFSVPGG